MIGLAIQIYSKRQRWSLRQKPRLKFQLHNKTRRSLLVPICLEQCKIEVDGVWYSRSHTHEPCPFVILPPNQSQGVIEVPLDDSWHSDRIDLPLQLTEGEYTIRVRSYGATVSAPDRKIPVNSLPLTIEVGEEDYDKKAPVVTVAEQ